jgi:hypothetical protein
VNRTLIVPEFDPELQPIGYALALEFLEVETSGGSSDRMRAAVTPSQTASAGNSTQRPDRLRWTTDGPDFRATSPARN